MSDFKTEKQKQKQENIGYISLVDFLAQNNIDVKDIRSVFEDTTKNVEAYDIVSNFLNDQRIVDIFNNAPIEFEQIADYANVPLVEYGYENFEELVFKINKYATKYPDKNLSDPQIQRTFIEGYHQSHKELDILANKQHTGDRITATVSELVQNAIDATAQAKDPSITPIGKFGMGAKTMFGSMGVGDYLLLQSKDKTFFVIKTGEGVESLICSDKIEFINAQLAIRGDVMPALTEGTGTIATLSYAKSKIDDSIKQGVDKFRYNPNVSIGLVKNGKEESINEVDLEELNTKGGVRIKTQDYQGHKTINIEDEGNGFDPIKLFQTSTKNSEERYSKEFNNDSKAFVNPSETNDIIMLIQGTLVSIDTIKNKDRYIESTLTKGIVIENSGYLQTSESRSDWSVTDYTNQSLEFAFNNILEDARSKQEQASLINTLYLWYESLPQAKKLSLTPIKDLLLKQAQDVKQDSSSQFLPNLREFGQFDDGNTIFLHPDLIGTYSPENIQNSQFKTSKNGFAVWGVDMQVVKKDDIKLYEALGDGESMQSQSQSKILKLDKSIPPQIWVDNQLLNGLEDLYKQQESADLINQYNYQVWLMNSSLNEVDNSYKTVEKPFEYFESYEARKYNQEKEKKLLEELNGKQDITELNNQYNIKDKSYLLNVSTVLDGKITKKESKSNLQKFNYSFTEILDTGEIGFDIGYDIQFLIDFEDDSYKIIQTRGGAIIKSNLPFKLHSPEGKKLLNSIQNIKNGNIELDEDTLSNIINDIFDQNNTSAFAKINSIIDQISSKEELKPELENIQVITNTSGGYNLHLPDDRGLVNIKKLQNDNIINIRFSRNGHDVSLDLQVHPDEIEDLFGKQLISTKISNSLISKLDAKITYSSFAMLVPDIINEAIVNKVSNGDNNQYESNFKGRSIRIKNVEGCDLIVTLDDNMNLIMSISNNESHIYEIEEYNLGQLSGNVSSLDYFRFTKFLSTKNKLNISDEVIETIKKIKQELVAADSMYRQNHTQDNQDGYVPVYNQKDWDMVPILDKYGQEMRQNFHELFQSGITKVSNYQVNTLVNTKDQLTTLFGNPTNEITLDYFKDQKLVVITIKSIDKNNSFISYDREMKFDGDFNFGDIIDIDNPPFAVDAAIHADNEEDGKAYLKVILNTIIEKYGSNRSTDNQLESQEVENKKELLNEFAQVGSRLESLKQKLNYSYDSQLMGKQLAKEVKTIDDAKLWLETNSEFIGYIESAGSSFEDGLSVVSVDMVMRVNRLKQNNYYIDEMDEAVSNTSLIKHHKEALQSTENLPGNQKSGVLMAVLSGQKTESYDTNKFNKIIQNLAIIELGLGQSSLASIDYVKSMLLLQSQGDKDLTFERVETITNNIIKIKNEKPELFDYVINKLTILVGTDNPLIANFFYAPFNVKDKDKALFRFLSTPDAVLLDSNKMDDISVSAQLTINPNNFTLGELGFMGRSVVHADQLQKDSIESIQKNSKAQELSTKINKEINRLATSQVSGDKWGTVLRELFQNSKDSANKMNGVSNIAFNQDLYTPDQDSWLGGDEYLRTEFSDDATGIPEFLFNYFNPTKSTKDIEDAVSAGAFGCGAITINSIADYYEIKTKNKDEKEGFHIKVEVTKSKDRTQVIGTKVIELSRTQDQASGTQIRMYSKNTKKSVIPELQALISQGALVELSELEVLNNPNINLLIQREQRKSPEIAKEVYKSNKVQFVEGVKPGYWVKNLFVSDLNHDQNQFSQPLPEFLSTMLKDNPVAVNFQNKLELVRTRTGFSESGEKEAINTLASEYLKHIATELYKGSKIKIPNLDSDLSSAYRKYLTEHSSMLSNEIFNNQGLSLDELQKLQDSQWIAILLEAPIVVDSQKTSLKEMFGILESVARQAQLQDITSKDKIEKVVNGITSNMDAKTKAIYDSLQKSELAKTYKSLEVNSAINLSLSTSKVEETETILDNKDLPAESLKTRELFESVFKKLTSNLPISRFEKLNTDHRMVYVSRAVGSDHSGQLKRENDQLFMLWKFDYNKIGSLGTKSELSTNDYKAMFEVIVHEIAHQLEEVGHRKQGTHDQIFDELMRCNFARLLNS